jgi:hypothetical protein
LEAGAEAKTADTTTKGTTTTAAAGVLNGPSLLEATSASAADAGREAAVKNRKLVLKSNLQQARLPCHCHGAS